MQSASFVGFIICNVLYSNSAPHLCNKIPENVKTAKSVDSFKTLLKTLTLKCLSYFSLPFVHKGVHLDPPPLLSTFP